MTLAQINFCLVSRYHLNTFTDHVYFLSKFQLDLSQNRNFEGFFLRAKLGVAIFSSILEEMSIIRLPLYIFPRATSQKNIAKWIVDNLSVDGI